MTTPAEEKPCPNCAVGYAVLRVITTPDGRRLWVYYCAACGHATTETPA